MISKRRRATAATNANDYSSRSHSVFVLRIAAKNTETGQETECNFRHPFASALYFSFSFVSLASRLEPDRSGRIGTLRQQRYVRDPVCGGDEDQQLSHGAGHRYIVTVQKGASQTGNRLIAACLKPV